MTTLVLEFKKIRSKYKTKHNNFYSSSKAEMVINEIEIENVFKSVYTTIIANRKKIFRKRFRSDY